MSKREIPPQPTPNTTNVYEGGWARMKPKSYKEKMTFWKSVQKGSIIVAAVCLIISFVLLMALLVILFN